MVFFLGIERQQSRNSHFCSHANCMEAYKVMAINYAWIDHRKNMRLARRIKATNEKTGVRLDVPSRLCYSKEKFLIER